MAKKPTNQSVATIELPPIVIDPPIELPRLASFDLGNATAKLRTADLATEFRSIAGRLSMNRAFTEIKSPLVLKFEGETLVFGDDARDLIDGQPTSYTDMSRYTSGFYRKLFAAALWRAFKIHASDGTLHPALVCSIPVVEYADGKADQIKEGLIGAYEMEGLDGIQLNISIDDDKLIIVPEGAGSYFASLVPGSTLAGREVAVLDVGFYTTDLVVFNKGSYVAGSASSCTHGVQQIARAVHRWLRQEHSYNGDLWSVDNALASGTIDIANKCVSIAEQRDEAAADLLDDLLTFYRSNIGQRTPSAVLLSGGGAPRVYGFVPDPLKDSGWRIVTGDPRRGNVDGSFDFLKKRQKRAVLNA